MQIISMSPFAANKNDRIKVLYPSRSAQIKPVVPCVYTFSPIGGLMGCLHWDLNEVSWVLAEDKVKPQCWR